MRVGRLVLGMTGAMALATSWAAAQQQPAQGCHAGISCRPRGFSALNPDKGNGSTLFGAGFRFGPGFQFFVVTPFTKPPEPEPAPVQRFRVFHLGNVSLLPSEPEPTPAPAPQPTPPAVAGPDRL